MVFTEQRTSPWVRRYGPVVFGVAALAYVAVYVHWPGAFGQVDALVYRFGATQVLDGHALYAIGMTGNPRTLLFDYPPFAALCFVPLALIGPLATQIFWLTANVALTAGVVIGLLRSTGLSAARGLWPLAGLLVGLALWLEPVRLTVHLGQVNLLLMALVVADLLGARGRRWAGVGIGLAAAIKLTPALFIVFLLAIGRWRAAAVAVATAAATVLVGFAVLPGDSRYFWLRGGFDDVARISHNPMLNTSLRGLFARLHYPTAAALAVAVVLVVAALVVAAVAWRRGHPALAVALVGMACCAASPFSWSHHWVWLTALIVHLGHRAYCQRSRPATALLWTLWAALAGWFVSLHGDPPEAGLLSLRLGAPYSALLPGAYLLVFVATVAVGGWWLRREGGAGRPAEESPEIVGTGQKLEHVPVR